ncbi:MAG TPA: hypothetical protein VK809_06485 [Bacteroidia bacterium]|jgi:hypothetical protein|nr:hypothetical protein [Bacteroidia bacterium]
MKLTQRILNRLKIIIKADLITHYVHEAEDAIFNIRKVHCVGDSHIGVFEYIANNPKKYKFSKIRFSFCKVFGATNMGLANPNSKTEAMPIFKSYIKTFKKKDTAILLLGEVDCGFVIWYRAEKYGLSIDTQMETSLSNYQHLILDICKILGTNVIICSIPLPTIKDGQTIGDIANKRSSVKASQKERTDLTLKYNTYLRKFCENTNIRYLDFEHETIDPVTGMVADAFLNETVTDHHLSDEKLAGVIYPKLKRMLENQSKATVYTSK